MEEGGRKREEGEGWMDGQGCKGEKRKGGGREVEWKDNGEGG